MLDHNYLSLCYFIMLSRDQVLRISLCSVPIHYQFTQLLQLKLMECMKGTWENLSLRYTILIIIERISFIVSVISLFEIYFILSLKVPFGDQSRLQSFPSLGSQSFTIEGTGLYHCACDVILSSVGWVSVTLGNKHVATVRAYTPSGKGMWLRQPSLVPEAIQERGRRSQKGNRTVFRGKSSIRN